MGSGTRQGAPLSILADTSGLLALLDRDNRSHEEVRPYHAELLVPPTVLTELDHLATRRLGASIVRDFYRSVASGYVSYAPIEGPDLERTFVLMEQYADANIGLVDAAIVALAERYRIRRVLTLDRHHFSMFRPKGLDYLELLP
jgi:predicted nucleic acid-binding protein